MGKFFEIIKPFHRKFIEDQQMYFVATAPLSQEGRVNLSPKGMDSFRVLDDHTVGYMDVVGSGKSTLLNIISGLLRPSEGQVLFDDKDVTALPPDEWLQFAPHFNILPSTRQLIIADIDLVQTSCGYGVPQYEYQGERTNHLNWYAKLGPEGLEDYKKKKNMVSFDGLPTDLSKSSKQ